MCLHTLFILPTKQWKATIHTAYLLSTSQPVPLFSIPGSHGATQSCLVLSCLVSYLHPHPHIHTHILSLSLSLSLSQSPHVPSLDDHSPNFPSVDFLSSLHHV